MIRSSFSDPSLRSLLWSRIIMIASAPLTLFLVVTFRSPAEQGFYFVFTNVQAVAFLFEFGIGAMLVQLAAHVAAPLNWTADRELVGDAALVSHALALLRQVQKWYALAALAVAGVVLPLGLWFLGRRVEVGAPAYSAPWIVLTLTLGVYLTVLPVVCFLEGSGQVRWVQDLRLRQAAASAVTLWLCIPVVGSLFGVAAASVASTTVAVVSVVRRFRSILIQRSFPARVSGIDQHVSRAQRRTVIGWVAGFLGPQLLVPIVFLVQGAEAAGRVGISLAAASAPLILSLSWLQARYPEYGSHVARGDVEQLDRVAAMATRQAVLICCALMGVMLFTVFSAGRIWPSVGVRFLPLAGIAALCASTIGSLLYQAMAAYLRAHREEALLGPIVIGTAAAVAAATIGARSSAIGATYAYSAGVLGVMFPVTVIAFSRRRHELNALLNPRETNKMH